MIMKFIIILCILSISSAEDTLVKGEWWSYTWCPSKSLDQFHFHRHGRNHPSITNHIGTYKKREFNLAEQSIGELYEHQLSDCRPEGYAISIKRTARVDIRCCTIDDKTRRKLNLTYQTQTFIENVSEPSPCVYQVNVCSQSLCFKTFEDVSKKKIVMKPKPEASTMSILPPHSQQSKNEEKPTAASFHRIEDKKKITGLKTNIKPASSTTIVSKPVTVEEQEELLQRVKEMFIHGYDSYMKYAFPEGELFPITCSGGPFDPIKIPLVTLIDTLDTLVIMNNYSEFRHAVQLVSSGLPSSFDFDINVSVFETTIRILGGLLSAHLMAIDPQLNIYGDSSEVYDDCLLALAVDMGDRLLPAFKTNTGIPYGTVNLRRGVPKGESEVASTAGAGSLGIEFEVLSILTGDEKYGKAAMIAIEAIFQRRSDINLLGKHIHVRTGKWQETLSGVGSNSDSFYEYLLKIHLLFRKPTYYDMFTKVFNAVKKYSLSGDWFVDVDMYSGKVRKNRSENLQAFWPGIEAIIGMTDSSASLLNAFYLVWADIGFLPEEFDYSEIHKGRATSISTYYPLRPELVESTYLHYRSTEDRSWLIAGKVFLESLEKFTKTDCGYASIKDVTTLELDNSMPSFFLSETCKYLYLLFDESNVLHDRSYIFSTEAHPFDPVQLNWHKLMHKQKKRNWLASFMFPDHVEEPSSTDNKANGKIEKPAEFEDNLDDDILKILESQEYDDWNDGKALHSPHMRCPKRAWWKVQAFDPTYQESVGYVDAKLNFPRKKRTNSGRHHPLTGQESSNLDVCSILEDPDIKRREETPESVVQLSVGDLGDFTVNIFPDGFVVFSHKYQNTLEIAGVGQPSILVREYSFISPKVAVTLSSIDGTTKNCDIDISISSETFSEKTSDIFSYHFAPRSCVVASFGATHKISSFPTAPIFADFSIPGDISGCKNVPVYDLSDSQSIEALNTKVEDTLETAQGAIEPSINIVSKPAGGSLWSTILNAIGNSKANTPTEKVKGNSALNNSIVICTRGDCMFEDKGVMAQAGGAAGVVVINTEDNIFVMSGKKEELSSENRVNIPVVMVSKKDGKEMLDILMKAQEYNLDPKLVMHVSSVPTILDNVMMGYSNYPKVRVGKSIMHVITSSQWAAVLSESTTGQWQMYLTNRDDIDNLETTPWQVSGRNGKTTTTSLLLSPFQMYMQIASEQCPSFVRASAHDITFE